VMPPIAVSGSASHSMELCAGRSSPARLRAFCFRDGSLSETSGFA
jgi:hypothetical protein